MYCQTLCRKSLGRLVLEYFFLIHFLVTFWNNLCKCPVKYLCSGHSNNHEVSNVIFTLLLLSVTKAILYVVHPTKNLTNKENFVLFFCWTKHFLGDIKDIAVAWWWQNIIINFITINRIVLGPRNKSYIYIYIYICSQSLSINFIFICHE
jgi:hypothetical protein